MHRKFTLNFVASMFNVQFTLMAGNAAYIRDKNIALSTTYKYQPT